MRTRGPGGASTLQRAESLLAAGRESEALPLFQRALNSCPGLADDIRCHVVRCLIRQGQIELAMLAHQELDATRAGPRPLYLMARDLEERGQNEVALAAYARLYLIASDFEDVRNRYEKMKQLTCPSRSAESLKELLARIPARYTGVERIGEGGMGVVLKAFDTQLEHPVAIKVMSVRASRDTLSIRRFQREIRALTLLSHPKIVKVFGCATAPIHYYTMECLDAPSLRQILARGPMELSRVLEIASRIAAALDHAHRHGIVHRDVKPANVLVAEGDAVKVVDFGLAYMADTTALTRSGHAPGTILYMAPEQLRGEKASPASDIYALGLVMIEMVTGLCPFAGLEPAQRLDSAPPPLPPHPRLGSELSALVMACTAVAPGERPDAGSLAARLAGLGARL
ncbi:MAG: protein kinase [Candidatus Riflebacteria bacterium]|nr:protein kinase [Candidatus Riflebacteria bacterium]